MLLSGCLGPSSPPKELIKTAENNRIQVQFDKIEEAEWEGNKGFFVYILATSLVDYHVDNDFLYRMDSILLDQEGREYEALFSEIIESDLGTDTLLFRQFYSPTLNDSIETLTINVFVKPTYYKRQVIFKDVRDDMSNLLENDLFIQQVQVENNQIHLNVFDVHHLNGLTVTLRQEKEDIFPAYTRTSYNQEMNQLTASYEFTKSITEPFTLTLNRLKIQEQIWTFTLHVPTT